ncbi:MAG: hypothetical protein VX223_08875 [Myxococcota bacterium]|nr:hypothetical protein [Myxococcota bacterium]
MRKLLMLGVALGLVIGCGKKDGEAPKEDKAAAEKSAAAEKKAEGGTPAEEKKAEGDTPAAEKKAEGGTPAEEKKAEGDTPAEEKKAEGDKSAAAPAPVAGTPGKLVGSWKVDIPALMTANPKMKEQVDAKPEAKAMMETMFGKLVVEFGQDTLTMSGMGQVNTGNYKVIKSEGNAVTVEAKKAGEDQSETFTLTFADDSHVTMAKVGDDMKLTLVRTK